jgi:outer membrane protein OmpA-like peptidoglycan-associated protein
MNMKKFTLAILLLILGFNVQAQSLKLKRADKYFNHLAYKSAGEVYEKLLGSKHESSVMLYRLAMCYYNTNRMEKAAETFSKYITTESASADELFYFSQSLKQSGKTVDGDEKLKALYSKANTDIRAKSLIDNLNYLESIKAKGEQYSMRNLEVNSEFSDFGGYPYQSSVLFLSSRYESLSVKREWTWDGTRFLDVFLADENNGQLVEKGMLKAICTKYHEGPACWDGGNSLYFTRNNAGKNKYDQSGIQNLSLYFGTIDVLGGISETPMPFCSSEYSVGHPALSKDGKTLYFASDMPGSKGVDIYEVAIEGFGMFGKPKRLEGNVNTDGDEMFPYVAKNGTMYFSSNGHIGLGGLDVFMVDKSGNVINLGQPLNSMNDDFAFILKADNKTGYVSSNRPGGKGDDDIYAFTYTGPVDITISGVVTDIANQAPLKEAYIVLLDEKGKQIASVKTDENGAYSIPALSGKTYTIQVKKENYGLQQTTLVTSESNVQKNFQLQENVVEFVFDVKDKKSQEALSGVAIKIEDLNKKTIKNLVTSESGSASEKWVSYKVGDEVKMNVTLTREGYLSKTVEVKFIIPSQKVNVSELMDIALSKLEVGGDLNEMIAINPIYFDKGKWDIRKDAAAELDKIVAIMNQYPSMEIELGSHTDCRASIKFNQDLSNKRAKSSAEYIQKKITNPSRIKGVGYGESKLKVDCPCEGAVKSTCSEEEHQKNRRTEFIITKMK